MTKKYIFITGGVMSGIGKGITTSSLLKILEGKGYKATAMKIDPYVNVDAGTMNPVEHGEVFVTDDGAECDQDIGNYERFSNTNITKDNYLTTGKVYQTVINKERNLEYDGKCVEVVPHIPNEVIYRIKKAGQVTGSDFVLIEIGGTIGEYQNLLFLEAARMMKLKNPKDVLIVLVSYLPIPKTIGEMKTKPTQSASRLLNEAGLQPDIIVGRSSFPIDKPRKKKISTFCNIDEQDVISAPDTHSIYDVPLLLDQEKIGERILKKLNVSLKRNQKGLSDWEKVIKKSKKVSKKVKIAIVGKYFETGDFVLSDSYISVIEAVKHAAWKVNCKEEITWLSSEKYEKNKKNLKELQNYDGVIIPGGFGSRGVEGKINVIQYCREKKIPFFGLCLGMQLAVIEFARNKCKIKDASSVEFNSDCKNPVIDIMDSQKELMSKGNYGGTMRLGAYNCELKKDTVSFKAYKTKTISERHRHRYEVNNSFRKILEKNGLVISGTNPELDLVEIVEIKKHPFFVGVQFHPEFKSRPLSGHPLFIEFLKASLKKSQR
jgi:CTP synthase